jgi:hypothetical protein
VKSVDGFHYDRFQGRNIPETTYYPDVEYKFIVNGVAYSGHRLSAVLSGSDRPGAAVIKNVLETYPVGNGVRVFYNPQNPSDCLLNPSEDSGRFEEMARFNYISDILPKDMLFDPVFTLAVRIIFCLTLAISTIVVLSMVQRVSAMVPGKRFESIPVLIASLVIMLIPISYRFFMRKEGKVLLERAKLAQTWPSAQGQITASDLVRELLEYTFVVNGKKHVGHSILIGGRKSGKMARERWKKLTKGDMVQVFYNPSNLEECALDPSYLGEAKSLSHFNLLGILL